MSKKDIQKAIEEIINIEPLKNKLNLPEAIKCMSQLGEIINVQQKQITLINDTLCKHLQSTC